MKILIVCNNAFMRGNGVCTAVLSLVDRLKARGIEARLMACVNPDTEGKQGWVCVVCGYIYEGDELPDDFICPLCKHGVADFEPIG